jgi:hypothetical protein
VRDGAKEKVDPNKTLAYNLFESLEINGKILQLVLSGDKT